MNRAYHASRLGAVVGATALAGWALWWVCKPGLLDTLAWLRGAAGGPAGWTLDRLVVDLAACGVILLYLGLVVSATVTLVGGTLGPIWWRRLVLTTCGVGLVGPVLAAPALATADASGYALPEQKCDPPCSATLSGLPLPELPEVLPQRQPAELITVRPGDSLWLIASRQLTPGADDSVQDVGRAVAALYAANRTVIGDDPDLIFPGTELTPPGGTP